MSKHVAVYINTKRL